LALIQLQSIFKTPRHHECQVGGVSLTNFKTRRVKDREREEKRVREAEMSSIASCMVTGAVERVVRRDWGTWMGCGGL